MYPGLKTTLCRCAQEVLSDGVDDEEAREGDYAQCSDSARA